MRRVLLVLLTASCGATSTTPDNNSNPGPDAGTQMADAGIPPVPSVHFMVNDRPHDATHPEADVQESRYGDPVRVVVQNLEPHSQVFLVATMNGMESSGTFMVGAAGTLDLGRDAPMDGTWTGADMDGIFWSMTQVERAPAALDIDLLVRVLKDGVEQCNNTLHRRYINANLVTQQIASGRTVGVLARPMGDGPFPALLAFGGSEGGTSGGEYSAYYWASMGYAVLGVGYFGAPGLPPQLLDVPLEILEEDLAFLAAQDHVDPQRIGVMGGSRGGELALMLGARFPSVKAVVAEVPSGLVWGSSASETRAAWTWQGVPLPYMPASGTAPVVMTDSHGLPHYVTRAVFLADIAAATPQQLADATIHVEDSVGPVLLYGGADDQLWPSCPMAQISFDRLTGHNPLDQMLCLEGAGHGIGGPGWSTMNVGEAAIMGGYLVLGGTPAATARAQRATDNAERAFLESALAL